ncbi:MAG: hypothetical protein HYY17_03705 [Planctomycetes bacterium]|nr:hypothetical protein [Planctomycetota bacterium]
MTVEQLRAIAGRAPFRPFRISLENGESFEVRHPEFIGITPSWVIIHNPEGEGIIFEVADVTSVRILARNGRRARS